MTEPVVEPFDRLLVARLCRLWAETDPARAALLEHAVAAVRDSHVCLTPDLHARRTGSTVAEAREAFESLAGSSVVSQGTPTDDGATGRTPFVLDEAGRLYLARYFDHQQGLAAGLVELASSSVPGDAPVDETLVDALFPPIGKVDLQREAAVHAVRHAFTIISGGPGTGKTSTVVKVLTLLVDCARRAGRPTPRIRMMAPTGKAAARLAEATRSALDKLTIDEALRAAVPTTAATLHRTLGVDPRGGFVHGRERPLDAEVVLVDEASMVDLATMHALVQAVAPGCRLILLGDRDQLASVEAGSVLGDLCDAASMPGSPLEGTVRELHQSHRFGAKSGIGRLARAIRDGAVDEALALFAENTIFDVELLPPLPERGLLPASIQRLAREGYEGLLANDVVAQLAALGRFRVLSAHRRGALGAAVLGARVARAIGRESGADAVGTPLIVLENDVDVGLFNGDVGVVGRDERGHATAHFDASPAPRSVGFGRLPRHEPCWAMTVHKSQGSEFDEVAVVIPEGSALASRELLYTALTRARHRAVVFASNATLRACVERRVTRASGLVDAVMVRAGSRSR